jgi:peptidyl-prolyl cis-trans isomerase D
MMQWMYRLSRSWPALILMGGLVLSFLVWGVADVFNGMTSNAVATVGSTEISQRAFDRAYRAFLRSRSQETGQEITPDMARAMGLGPVALQQMITRVVLDNEAARLDLVTPPEATTRNIQSMAAFRGATGRFDPQTYAQRVQSIGYTQQDFFDEVRADMTRAQFTGMVVASYGVPAGYAQALVNYFNERRAVEYVIVSTASLPAIAPPDDKALEAYVKANASRFSTPEYRDVEFAFLGPEDIAGQSTVTDAQIRQEFEARKATYIVPEKRDVEQLPFPTEAEAKAALAKFKAGAKFDAVIQQRGFKSADISGTYTRSALPEAIGGAAFALPLNGVSEPVKSTFGYTLLRVTKIEAGSNKTFEDVKEDIRKALALQIAADKLSDIANAFTDARSAGEGIAEAAKKSGMKTGHVIAMDASGKDPDGRPAGAPQDPEFLAQVASAEVGEDTDPILAKSGIYFAVKVNGVTPPKLKTLDQVRAEATAAWLADRRTALLSERAKALTAQAVKEKSLTGVATALKATIQKSPALMRSTNDAMFQAGLVRQVFDAPPAGIVSGAAGADQIMIAQITGIAHPLVMPTAPEFIQAAQQISQSVGGDFVTTLAEAARTKQGVKINRTLLETVTGGGS